mmetsp:Transcript_18585/g.74184  ORF Transcript_18585/g.74184 Transcript_18585/m.74184 type:complete len:306 (+) Transcript_18585:1132-2049(+)
MMRVLPNLFARSAWPTALLILCAPVCASSSRLSQICAPPTLSESRFAWYSGVGPPMNCRRYSASSSRKAGSAIAAAYSASSRSCAAASVSGMYRPPNAPKWSGSVVVFSAGSSAEAASVVVVVAASAAAAGTVAASLSDRTNVFRDSARVAGVSSALASRFRMIADPTTTPSAPNDATDATFSGVDTPNPTAKGAASSTAPRTRPKNGARSTASAAAPPVTPSTETQYIMAPPVCAAALASERMRASVVVGATIGTYPSPTSAHASSTPSNAASSGGKSTMMKPSTPADFASAASFSKPYARNGL